MWLFREIKYWMGHVSPKFVLKLEYWKFFKRFPNIDHPKDLNEKILWTLCNRDKALWARLADKVAVREYVKERGLEEILIPVQGYWENPNDIPFDKLTPPYVLKPNNGTASNTYVTDYNLNKKLIIRKLKHLIRRPEGYDKGEVHYSDIPRKIIAENMLDKNLQDFESTSMIDYKVLCFNGEPDSIMVLYDRDQSKSRVYLDLYSTTWDNLNHEIITAGDEIKGEGNIPRPKQLDKLLDYARTLAKGLYQCRVDFYLVDNKVYFGEITLTGAGGHIPYFTKEALNRMGKKIKLPSEN